MPRLHVELDGSLRNGALVLKDGIPQADVTALSLCLDSQSSLQVVTLEHARVIDGDLWQSVNAGVITKLTITAEYEEVQ